MDRDLVTHKVLMLFEWAKENGAELEGLGVRSEAGCSGIDTTIPSRTVYAKREIQSGEKILKIPKELILSESVARKSWIGQGISKVLKEDEGALEPLGDHSKDEHVIALIYLMSFLIYEKWVNQSNFWKCYVEALPESFPSLPIYWEEKDLVNAFNGTSLLHTVMVRKVAICNLLSILKHPLLREYFGHRFVPNIDQAMWAYSVISTRAFFFIDPSKENILKTFQGNGSLINGSESESMEPLAEHRLRRKCGLISGCCDITTDCAPELCLVPILDMLNHSQDQLLSLDIGSNGVVLEVGSTIKAGDEIFNNYGTKGNEALLANYGFVIENNKLDFTKVKLMSSGDELIEEKLELIKSLEAEVSLIHALFEEPGRKGVDEPTMKTMRILCLDSRAFSDLRKKYTISEIPGALSEFISPQNEIHSISTLWTLFANKLRVLMEPREPSNLPAQLERMAEIYRSGQIRIYHHHFMRINDAFTDFIKNGEPISCGDFTLPLFLTRYSLNIASKEFLLGMDAIERAVSELEEDAESDLIIPMLLIDLRFRGPHEIREFILSIDCYSLEGDLEEFFITTVKPLTKEFPHSFPEDIYTPDSFMWAAAAFEANRVVIHDKLLESTFKNGSKHINPLSFNEIPNFSSKDHHIPCCLLFNYSLKK